MLPHPALKTTSPFIRSAPNDGEEFITLKYPYHLYGLVSHIRPHIVIFNTGSKLVKEDIERGFYEACSEMNNGDELRRSLDRIKGIYHYWMSYCVPTSFTNGVIPDHPEHAAETSTTLTGRTRIGRKRLHTISDAASTSATNFPDISYSSASTGHGGSTGRGGRTSSGSRSVSHASGRTCKSRRIAGRTGVDGNPSPSTNSRHALTQLKLKLHGMTNPQPSENNERVNHWFDQCKKAVLKRHRQTSPDDYLHPKCLRTLTSKIGPRVRIRGSSCVDGTGIESSQGVRK